MKIVVVQDMWLTGFDVPPLHTIYIDKPMKDHGLLQAIARVNRVFQDKPGGLVVDYIGIGDDLRPRSPRYAAEDVEDAMVPLRVADREAAREARGPRPSSSTGPTSKSRQEMSSTERSTLFAKVVGDLLADDEKTERYLDEYAAFAELFALVSPTRQRLRSPTTPIGSAMSPRRPAS